MHTLIRFELRKITGTKLFYGVLILLTAVILLLVSKAVSGAYVINQEGKELKGMAAITLRKSYDRRLAGPLDSAKLEQAVKQHQQIVRDPKNVKPDGKLNNGAYAKYEEPNEQIHTILRYVLSPLDKYDYYAIDTIPPENAERFDQLRIDKVNYYLNFNYSYGNYTAGEKAFFQKMNEDVPVPLQMDYVKGWEESLRNLPLLIMAMAFVTAASLASLFAGEYQQGTDALILTTRYGRNKVILAKIAAGFTVCFIILLYGLGAYMLLMLGIYGFDGGSASVQIISILAPVPYTVLMAFLWTVLIGCMACLLTGALTMWLSSWLRTPFAVIMAMGIILIGPLFVPASKSSRIFNYLMNLWPGKMVNGFQKMMDYQVFHLFGQYIPIYKVMPVFAIVVALLVLPFTYRAFKKHQVA